MPPKLIRSLGKVNEVNLWKVLGTVAGHCELSLNVKVAIIFAHFPYSALKAPTFPLRAGEESGFRLMHPTLTLVSRLLVNS